MPETVCYEGLYHKCVSVPVRDVRYYQFVACDVHGNYHGTIQSSVMKNSENEEAKPAVIETGPMEMPASTSSRDDSGGALNRQSGTVVPQTPFVPTLKLWLCSCLHMSHLLFFMVFLHLFLRLSSDMEALLQREQVMLDKSAPKSVSKRSVSTSGLLEQNLQGLEAIQLVGAIPTLQIKTNGTIGPWTIDNNTNKDWAELTHDRSELRILQAGVYFINAQIFYVTGDTSNSYEIVKWGNSREKETLSVCAHHGASKGGRTGSSAEISCCTAVISHLKSTDRLRLHQIEQNRVILFSRGFSHWGIIKIQGED